MGTRTVRLDDEAEKKLARLRKATGLSISEVLKRGLEAFEERAKYESAARPHDIYRSLDLGEGGWSRAPAAEAKQAIRTVVGRKYHR